ncbi:hypothetical protein [Marinospirillum sp.]|uniref:hypothetical protein n=1 Tax=Marinospirillum sp. TaxID=2183934 RepID=UPI0025C3D794|nr:hypothetical protein [Marinospirillum sp.]
MKPLKFVDTSLKDMRDMPTAVRQTVGLELMTVQYGGEPSDFKPMQNIGTGAKENTKDIQAGY